jgi:FlaA1/EpsC-like NDP-sugar epimerase
MIRLSGKTPHDDIAIEFTGVRAGEKLFEELATDTEATRPTSHAKIRVWQLPKSSPAEIDRALAKLADVTDAPRDTAITALMQAVQEYRPTAPPTMRLIPDAA